MKYIFESEKPITRCLDCLFKQDGEAWCDLVFKELQRCEISEEKPSWCPLAEVKEGSEKNCSTCKRLPESADAYTCLYCKFNPCRIGSSDNWEEQTGINKEDT